MGLELDSNGYIVVNNMMETSVKGIYAAGDCVNLTQGFRQIIVAAAQAIPKNTKVRIKAPTIISS
jgi:thioredoxin reductase (NADPH) (EC 1.8.1.9)